MVIALALALLVCAYSQTPQSRPRAFKLTTAQQQEYAKLVESKSGKTAVEAWARKHKLEIVSLKGYSITVIPEQEPQYPTDPERAAACDPKLCPTAGGVATVVDAGGKLVGVQTKTCKASKCELVWVEIGGKRVQIRKCSGWTCVAEGPIYRY
jgi:hypothetical protein